MTLNLKLKALDAINISSMWMIRVASCLELMALNL